MKHFVETSLITYVINLFKQLSMALNMPNKTKRLWVWILLVDHWLESIHIQDSSLVNGLKRFLVHTV